MSRYQLSVLLAALLFSLGMSAEKSLSRNVTAVIPQSATTAIRGVVIDDIDAVVAGAEVVLLNTATGFLREATTNEAGVFAFHFLPPGDYRVTITRQGFAVVVIEGLSLNVNDPRVIRVRLKVGELHEVIGVKADADVRDSPAASAVIDRQFVDNLPLNGRTFLPLITLTPGVAPAPSGAAASQWLFTVNGQRPTSNYLTVDGVSANIAVYSGGSFRSAAVGAMPGLSIFGGFNNLVSIDALQEIKVLTSANAPELGRTSGAQISIVTRSGTSKFHGALFDYVRNEALDANDWFANRNQLPKPPLRQNDFGGVLGGPIPSPRFGADKSGGQAAGGQPNRRSFFFFSYEGMRVSQPQIAITETPSLGLRRAAAPQLRPFLDAFPLPNGPDPKGTWFNPFIASYSNPSTLDATSLRIDHNVNARLQVFGRYNVAPSENKTRDTDTPSIISRTDLGARTVTLGGTFLMSRRVNSDFRFNSSDVRYHNAYGLDAFAGATPPADSQIFPSLAPRGSSQIGFGVNIAGSHASLRAGEGGEYLQRQLNLVNTISISTGAHQLKLGIDYRRLSPRFTPPAYTQLAGFQNFSQLEAGRAAWVTLSAQDSAEPRFTNYSAFWEDAWNAGPRLSLTYGMRWEANPAPSSAKGVKPGTIVELDDLSATEIASAGARLWKASYTNFAPRFGAVYQLTKIRNLETILRGGIGVFYDLGPGAAAAAFGGSRSAQLSDVAFPLAPSNARPPALDGPGAANGFYLGFAPDFTLPYSLQWNLALEQSLGPDQTLTATYVAAQGRRLFNTQYILFPRPWATTLTAIKNEGRSDYHALQVQFQRRLSKGLQALAGYTWSHSIDLVSDEVQWGLSKGPSDFDLRHIFSAAVTYDLPAPASKWIGLSLFRDWSLDSIVRAQSAPPVNVVTINGAALIGPIENKTAEVLRPNLIVGVPLYLHDTAAPGGRRINPAAFSAQFSTIPTVSTPQGTLGRNALRGFPFRQIDLSLRRRFHLADNIDLQFKADLFNLFNQPNFNSPNASLFNGLSTNQPPSSNPSFGLSNSLIGRNGKASGVIGGLNSLYQAGGPRSIQLSLKLQF
jgi:hypothetical protein